MNVLGTARDEWALATPTASRGCATVFWLALSVHTRLARCHHKSLCASTTPGTVSKPQRKPKTPWRARCFSGMRWSGCGTGLQHPSNQSCVLFVDARQHRDRAWYIEAIYDPFAANDRALRRVGLCAAMRDRAGSVSAPAASCRKFRRGSFSSNLSLWSLYSITSSARASSVAGTSRPRALAVARLMMNSNLLDCTTGRSAGFSPLRMRPA